MRKTFFLTILIIFGLSSCESIKQRHQAGVVVQVGNQAITRQDLDRLTAGMSSEDSAQIAEQYIQDRSLDMLLYEEADKEASERIEKMVAEYRRSLYRHEYERKLVTLHMPQQVEDTIVEQFYQTHQQQLRLNESILKGVLLVLPNGTPKQDKLKKWLKDLNEENMEHIEKYAYQYATGYELFVDEWKTANQLVIRLPIDATTLQQEMKRHTLVECQDSTQVYLLQITDKHFKGDVKPLDYAAPEIKRIILNRRQTVFLQEKRKDLYEDALQKKKIIRLVP